MKLEQIFTEQEIQQLLDFYKNANQAFLEELPESMLRNMSAKAETPHSSILGFSLKGLKRDDCLVGGL